MSLRPTRVALLATLLSFAAPMGVLWPARADPPPAPVCNSPDSAASSPRVARESLSFRGLVHPFNVVLPPDYRTGTRRYPVLYLLHGGTGQNHNSWIANTDLLAFTAAQDDAAQAIVVTPEAGYAGLHVDWNDDVHLYETFHTQVLVPYIDAHYRTLGDRGHRAIAGLSAGATGAAGYAARHPDLFAVVGGFSGAYALTDPEIRGIAVASASDMAKCGGFAPALVATTAASVFTDEAVWRDASPVDLANNVRGATVFLSSGDGTPCDAVDAQDLAAGGGAGVVEALLHKQTVEFDGALTQAGVAHETRLSCGVHTWRHWQDALHQFWPRMFAHFGTPRPAQFSVRRASSQFSAWGWTFGADPVRAPEFLHIADASRRGFGISGSGRSAVATGPIFRRGAPVRVTIGGESSCVHAGGDGRLSLTIDLGPAHTNAQYSPVAMAQEAQGGYFSTRIVRFDTTRAATRRCAKSTSAENRRTS